MKKNKKNKIFSDTIIYTKCLNNSTVVVVDTQSNIRYLDKSLLTVLKGYSLGFEQKWYKNINVSFSNDGNYFAIISEDSKYSTLYNANTKKPISKIDRNRGGVSCVAVDPNGKYFFSCGEDGKTFAIDIKTAKLSFTLPGHIDSVNDIIFSPNKQNVATCSYDKKILIFNYAMMTPVAKLIAHTAPVMKIHFIDNYTLFSVDKNGGAIIWDLATRKVQLRLTGIHDGVTEVCSSEKFLFLGTDLGFVIVYELENFTKVSGNYIKLSSSITSLEFDKTNEELIVASDNGELQFHSIYDGEEQLEYLLDNKDYDSIQAYVEKNPLLEYTKAYMLYNEIWEETLSKASMLLQNVKKEEAKEILNVFHKSPSKNNIMKKMLKEYEEFGKFVMMVKNGNIALAYSIANKNKSYKTSKIYLALEERWKKLFAKAQILSLEPNSKDNIYKLLYKYRGISEKTKYIQDMLVQSNVFARFKDAILKKEYKIAFELVRVNRFLAEFKEYTALQMYGDKLYININKFIEVGNLHDALKLLRVLIDFPDFESEAKNMIKEIESQGKFNRAVEDNDLSTAYDILSKSTVLDDTSNARKLIKSWNNDLNIAESCAAKGDIAGIDSVMSEYKNISSKNMSLVAIYTWAYITQIENAIKQNADKVKIENGIKHYVLNFGLDDHISSVIEIFEKKYNKSKLNLDSIRKGSRELWRISMRPLNILE